LSKCCNASLTLWFVLDRVHEHPDPPHVLLLLRARGERPADRRTGNSFDEITSPHCLHLG
jgi:hypothetical protein